MTSHYHSIAVYLGSSGRGRPVYKQETMELGQSLGENGRRLIYGGMNAGLMGVLADSVLNNGGEVTGVVPLKIQDSERMMDNLTETILVGELCDRKRIMFQKADAIVAMPGGFGTLDEVFEVLFWRARGLHDKPVVFVNVEGYWDDILTYLKSLPDCADDYYCSVDHGRDVVAALNALPAAKGDKAPGAGTSDRETYLPHFEDEATRATHQPILIDIATIENSYFVSCALGLKQLAKHDRGIGFINDAGQFTALINWITLANREKFITDKCLQLFSSADNEDDLWTKLKDQQSVDIDLHAEKWGASIIDE